MVGGVDGPLLALISDQNVDGIRDLRLLRLFDFYLALAFLVSTALRVQQYHAMLQVVRAVPGRWPHLFKLVKQYRHLFLTWRTILPLAATLALLLAHTLLRRLVLEGSDLSVQRLLEMTLALPCVVVAGLAMLGVDGYVTFRVGGFDRAELEKYFDQAEFWLRSWTAPVVSFFTLGYINPRKMVRAEVEKALLDASAVINTSLWWTTLQAILRIAFGLSLWLAFAFS